MTIWQPVRNTLDNDASLNRQTLRDERWLEYRPTKQMNTSVTPHHLSMNCSHISRSHAISQDTQTLSPVWDLMTQTLWTACLILMCVPQTVPIYSVAVRTPPATHPLSFVSRRSLPAHSSPLSLGFYSAFHLLATHERFLAHLICVCFSVFVLFLFFLVYFICVYIMYCLSNHNTTFVPPLIEI